MAKIIRVHDSSVTERRIHLVIQESSCPGLIEFMSKLEYGTETPLIRGVVYQWFLTNRAAGKLNAAVESALAAPGGVTSNRNRCRSASHSQAGHQVYDRSSIVPEAASLSSMQPEKQPAPQIAITSQMEPPLSLPVKPHSSNTSTELAVVIDGVALNEADIRALAEAESMFG